MSEIEVNDTPTIKDSVVSFSRTYDEPNGKRLLDYWNGLRGDRARPAWKEFNFNDVIDIVTLMVVKDVIDGGEEFRNRFWGTTNNETAGYDGTGKTIAECYDAEYVDSVLKLFRAPLSNPTPMVLRGKTFLLKRTKWRPYSALCVGFTGKDGTVSQLVTAYDE